MANTKIFYYKSSRDIISTLIDSIIAFLCFLMTKAVVVKLLSEHPDFKEIITGLNWGYIIVAILIILLNCINIHSSKYNCLAIKKSEIVYCEGWLSKSTTSIPTHKIRSCTKKSGPLQRACNTMDISITTAGDDAEIYFRNIDNGQMAYQMLCKIAMENAKESESEYQMLHKILMQIAKESQ